MFKFAFLKSFSGNWGEAGGVKGKSEYCPSGRQSYIVRDETGADWKDNWKESGRLVAGRVVGRV